MGQGDEGVVSDVRILSSVTKQLHRSAEQRHSKIKNTNENSSSSAAPRAMNTALSASTMPMVRTFARWGAGTAKLPMMSANTNRLSTERLFSTTYPVKYCAPGPSRPNARTRRRTTTNEDVEHRPSGRLAQPHLVRPAA